jgi:hypothetical protein
MRLGKGALGGVLAASAMVLVAVGIGLAALARRRRRRQQESGSFDPAGKEEGYQLGRKVCVASD